ncbi:type II secretion system F family protein [Sagittula sp. SSi028]|uniref:type II secretion system F family protein n=1 Tax=Sagittula sp. SSi028 TaxID=3400636 RepID=UPI003AF7957B
MSLIVLFFVMGFLATLALAVWALVLADKQRRARLARIARAVGRDMSAAALEDAPETDHPKRDKQRLLARLERQFALAGREFAPQRVMGGFSLAVLASYGGFLLLGVNPVLGALSALILPAFAGYVMLARARRSYQTLFTAALPEALDIFARGLRAGRPVADSLSIVVDNSEGAVRREFLRCRDEMRLGTGLAETLARLNTRMNTPEVSFFAVATALQSETGGNLIETMDNLADQLRDRRKLKRKARALTSEARASAVILAALPFAVGMILVAINASYLAPLWTDPRGQKMALFGVFSISAGIALMLRMGKLDV